LPFYFNPFRLDTIEAFAYTPRRQLKTSVTNIFSRKLTIMEFSSLEAISPVDGRYRRATEKLADYFSEGALIKYRVMVEVEYFIALCELPLPQLKDFDKRNFKALRVVVESFSIDDARRIKEIEKKTNHDVKAVEYFLKEKFDGLSLQASKEFIHFGLTSQDINNTAVPYSLKQACADVLMPFLEDVVGVLQTKAREWKDVPMLARTHGQPASPTRLGKEVYVFVERLIVQKDHLDTLPFSAKFGGATGNFNAHHVAYPDIDWMAFADNLVNNVLGLKRSKVTTQIEHYDNLAAFCDNLKRINTILIDLARDLWTYISMDYFKQKIKKGEVGSSAMPHKVNPIDFENAEGNLGVANAILEHLAAKLPISRLQRDLTDSTVTRNIGVPIAHTIIGLKSLLKGLNKLILNTDVIRADLHNNWAVVAEAIQTVLRREGYPEPFEALKALTRTHAGINEKTIAEFIETLEVSRRVKDELLKISPDNYTGICSF
jgi:adenylosuccinate lyase